MCHQNDGPFQEGNLREKAHTLRKVQCHGPRGRREEVTWPLTVTKALTQAQQAGGRECEGLNCWGVRAGEGQGPGHEGKSALGSVLDKGSSGLGHGWRFRNLLSA